MKKVGKTLVDILTVLVPSIAFMIIFVAFVAQIFARYFFGKSIAWSNEISVLGYMWVMFFGAGRAIDTDAHAVFSLVYDVLSQKGRLIFRLVYNILLVVAILICFMPCVDKWMGQKMITGVLKLPYKVVFAPFLYMLAEIVIRSLIEIKKSLTKYKEGTL